MRIEIIRGSDLAREVFTLSAEFGRSNIALKLTGYHRQSRPTKRHNWRNIEFYSWGYDRRQAQLKAEDVPITPDVIADAKAQIKAMVDEVGVTI